MVAIYEYCWNRPMIGVAINEVAAMKYLMKKEMNYPCVQNIFKSVGVEMKDPDQMSDEEVKKSFKNYCCHSYSIEEIEVIC